MLKLDITKRFKKDIAKINFTNQHYSKYIIYLGYLLEDKNMPKESRDHFLEGEWEGYREFHVSGDLLVIYKKYENILYLARVGTHAQLFKS